MQTRRMFNAVQVDGACKKDSSYRRKFPGEGGAGEGKGGSELREIKRRRKKRIFSGKSYAQMPVLSNLSRMRSSKKKNPEILRCLFCNRALRRDIENVELGLSELSLTECKNDRVARHARQNVALLGAGRTGGGWGGGDRDIDEFDFSRSGEGGPEGGGAGA